ncbi:hypothetical protein OG21DRAFT_1512981 [Imleria badia]|nr:hypothetical protein OG21DRAFT_1512981 [Imleria badia]
MTAWTQEDGPRIWIWRCRTQSPEITSKGKHGRTARRDCDFKFERRPYVHSGPGVERSPRWSMPRINTREYRLRNDILQNRSVDTSLQRDVSIIPCQVDMVFGWQTKELTKSYALWWCLGSETNDARSWTLEHLGYASVHLAFHFPGRSSLPSIIDRLSHCCARSP